MNLSVTSTDKIKYDVSFVDIPSIEYSRESELDFSIGTYYKACDHITNQVTGHTFDERPYYYTTGILCLSSYVKKSGFRVGYMNFMIDKNIDKIITNTNVLCFSAMTITINYILELAKNAKSLNPDIKIFIGGYHATYRAKEILQMSDNIDLVILGEGEKSLLNILQGINLEEIDGICYKKDNRIYSNPKQNLLKPEEIPIPDYSLIEDSINLYNIQFSTMRGCIGKCRYCVNHGYWGKPRLRPVSQIKEEIIYLSKILKKNTLIHFTDNVFTLNKKRLEEIGEVFCQCGKDYFYECDTLANLIDQDTIRILMKMNVVKIQLGFEDCEDAILKIANKNVTFMDNIRAANIIANESDNICIYAYWLLGLPGSNKETIEKNISEMVKLIKDGIVHIISPKIFIPYPGTEFFENSNHYSLNILSLDWDNYERRTPPFPYRLENLGEMELYYYLMKALKACVSAYMEKWKLDINDLI